MDMTKDVLDGVLMALMVVEAGCLTWDDFRGKVLAGDVN